MMLGSSYGHATLELFIILDIFGHGIKAEYEKMLIYHKNEVVDTKSVCLRKYNTNDCKKFLDTFNQSDLPKEFPRKYDSVEKPSFINITVLESDIKNYQYSGMSVLWKSPLSGNSRRKCFGYLLVYYFDSNKKSCRLFQLNQTNEILSEELKYVFNIPRLQAPNNYTVKVYSMPPPSAEDQYKKNAFVDANIVVPKRDSKIEPAKWIPIITYKIFDNGTIDCKFTLPPPWMNITIYEITLFKLPEKKLLYKEKHNPQVYQETEVLQKFTVNESGDYRIQAMLKEEEQFRNVQGKCRCWIYINQEQLCENTCRSTYTDIFVNVTDNKIEPAKWIPIITYKIFDNGTIDCKFTLPPPWMNITIYEITLFKLPGKTLLDEKKLIPQAYQETEVLQKFTVNESGHYRIQAMLKEEEQFRNVQGKCRCWIYINQEKLCENTCRSTYTDIFVNVTEPVTDSTILMNTTITVSSVHYVSSKQDGSHNISEAFVGVLAGLLPILAFAILIFCGYRRNSTVKQFVHRWCCLWLINPSLRYNVDPQPEPKPVSGETTILAPLTRKYVYIMYADDHQPHLKLVESFCLFLEMHCHCMVIVPSLNCPDYGSGVYEWFISKINIADCIIFINSRGAENLILNHLESNSHNGRKSTNISKRSTIVEAFHYSLKHLLMNENARERKVVLVSFQGKHCQKYLQVPEVYMLPEQLPHVLLRIHNLNAKNAKAYDNVLPLQMENVPNLLEGNQLFTAIKCVKDYEEHNGERFEKSHETITLPSFDSGYSGLYNCTNSVSTQDLTFSELASPVSVFEQPNFDRCLDTSTLHNGTTPQVFSRYFTKAQTYSGNCVSELEKNLLSKNMHININNLSENLSYSALDESHFNNLSKQKVDDIKEKRFDEMSIISPEQISEIDSCSRALANINNEELIHQYSQNPYNYCDGTYMEAINVAAEVELTPPETLSNIHVDSISTALFTINANAEK